METEINKYKTEEVRINNSDEDEFFKTLSHDVTMLKSNVNDVTEYEEYYKALPSTTLKNVTLSIEPKLCSENVIHAISRIELSNDISLFLKNIIENNCKYALTPEPEILFKHTKRLIRKLFPATKKPFYNYAHLVKSRIVHCKYKHRDKNNCRRLESYYKQTKQNCCNPSRIQQDLYTDSVLNCTVSSTGNLKKVLVKENLLDECDETFFKDIINRMLENEPSQEILTRINSGTSQDDSLSTNTIPSVIEVKTEILPSKTPSTPLKCEARNEILKSSFQCNKISYFDQKNANRVSNSDEQPEINPFQTDIISVAVAQITNASILKYTKDASSETSREEILYKENLASAESFIIQSETIASTSSLELSEKGKRNNYAKDSNNSGNTLTGLKDSFSTTGESDACVIAETSSYFKSTSLASSQTLTPLPDNDFTNLTEPCNIYFQSSNKEDIKLTLLDTIINAGIFQQIPASRSRNEYMDYSNNVIITDELRKIQPLTINALDQYSKNVVHKSINKEHYAKNQKSVNLPNEDLIKTIITETEKAQKRSCSEESRNYTPSPDVLEKLLTFLDVSLSRMEESLMNKISKELENTFSQFEKYLPFTLSKEHNFCKPNIRLPNKAKESDISKMESGRLRILNECTQCGLIQNEVIDELMLNVKVDGSKTVTEDCPLKLLKSKIKIRAKEDYFEVLKPPLYRLCTSKCRENGESLMTSSYEAIKVKGLSVYERLVMCITTLIYFFKANLLVIISVPVFILSIFLIYRFLVLVK